MLRILLLVVAAVLVNTPWLHDTYVQHEIDTRGETVIARVVAHEQAHGQYYLTYQLPAKVDPHRHRYAVTVDATHYDAAIASGRIPAQVVPGSPSESRVAGERSSGVLVVIAVVGDLVLLIIALVLWRGRARLGTRRVVGVEPPDAVEIAVDAHRVYARIVPTPARLPQVGHRARGRLLLVAATDLMPDRPVEELVRLEGTQTRVSGWVVDVDRGHVLLQLVSGFRVLVEFPEGTRARADLRQLGGVTGEFQLRREL